MNPDAISKFTDALADDVLAKLGPKLVAYLDERRTEKLPDPLLSVAEIATRLRLSRPTVYSLFEQGLIKRAKGLKEIRARQSEVDAYATSQ